MLVRRQRSSGGPSGLLPIVSALRRALAFAAVAVAVGSLLLGRCPPASASSCPPSPAASPQGQQVDPNRASASGAAPVRPSPDSFAFTGAEISGFVEIAGVLLLAGGSIVLIARARRLPLPCRAGVVMVVLTAIAAASCVGGPPARADDGGPAPPCGSDPPAVVPEANVVAAIPAVGAAVLLTAGMTLHRRRAARAR